MEFKTHTGEVITGERLQKAFTAVADDWANLGRKIRKDDHYASHVTEADKDAILERHLQVAADIRAGNIRTFTTWQRVNLKLTGECVALLP